MKFQFVEAKARTSEDVKAILRLQVAKYGRVASTRWYWTRFWPAVVEEVERENPGARRAEG